VRTGEAVHVTSDGEGMLLAPTFVDDIAEVILTSLDSSWTGTVNVASPEALSIRQIADTIGRQLGKAPKLEVFPRQPVSIVPNLDRLAERFDLGRFTRFEDGLVRTIGRV
jgi:nucleoside-diphosphate-sugar epimerase